MQKNSSIYTGNPPLLARVPIDRTAFARPYFSLPLPILQSVPTLSTTSPSLSLSLSLSLSVSNTHPSSTFSLCGSLSGPCFTGRGQAESACLVQPVWLRATLALTRAPVSPKISAENRRERGGLEKNREKARARGMEECCHTLLDTLHYRLLFETLGTTIVSRCACTFTSLFRVFAV